MRNRAAKKSINFYEQKAKDVKAPIGGRPSIFVIQVPYKHKHSPNSKLRSSQPRGQSIVLQTHSSHLGETSDCNVETEFNSNQSQSSNTKQGVKLHSKSNGLSKSSAQRQTTLQHETAKSQFAPKGTYNHAYLNDESSQHGHRTKGSDSHLDNQGFSRDGDDPVLHHHQHPHYPQPNGYKQQPIEVLVQIVDRFVLVLGFFFFYSRMKVT